MSVINKWGRPVRTWTQRQHHRDTDELARQQPILHNALKIAIEVWLGAHLQAPNPSINSSVEGRAFLGSFPGTPALYAFCQMLNAGRTSRLIEPRHIYGVMLLRVLGGHPDTWLTRTTPRKGVGYGIRTYVRVPTGPNGFAEIA